MRMTNKIMQNNSLYNINNNKQLVNKLSTMMSTNKKITRPSDDPVIAVRALRLRSDVAQITQYDEKNAEDAKSWLKVTGDALNTTTEVLRKMVELAGRGAEKDLGYDNLEIIVTQLKSLRDEYYGTGNVDFAGRYIFTGFRTNSTLTYTDNAKDDFRICEKMNISDIGTLNYTSIGDLKGISKENYDPKTDPNPGEVENNINNANIYRMMLAYDDLKSLADGQELKIEYVTDPSKLQDVNAAPPNNGLTTLVAPADIVYMSTTDVPNPYEAIQQPGNAGKAILVKETGELLIGNDLYDKIKNNMAPPVTEDTQIRVTYEKNSWKTGDMRPQHYFECTKNPDTTDAINYNWSLDETTNPPTPYISLDGERQDIEYDVGYNQKILVNTMAGDVFSTNMDRVIDDLEQALSKLKEINTAKTNMDLIKKEIKEGEAGYDNIVKTCEAADKAFAFIRENMQKQFEHLISQVEGFQADANVAVTDNGTRADRLDLIMNRLTTQKTTFQTLQSENEDIDVTEVMVQLTSMDNSYNSALMATGKIMKNSLMNYI